MFVLKNAGFPTQPDQDRSCNSRSRSKLALLSIVAQRTADERGAVRFHEVDILEDLAVTLHKETIFTGKERLRVS
jgi:hypothetical protein